MRKRWMKSNWFVALNELKKTKQKRLCGWLKDWMTRSNGLQDRWEPGQVTNNLSGIDKSSESRITRRGDFESQVDDIQLEICHNDYCSAWIDILFDLVDICKEGSRNQRIVNMSRASAVRTAGSLHLFLSVTAPNRPRSIYRLPTQKPT